MQKFICDDVFTVLFLDKSDNIVAERKAKSPLPSVIIGEQSYIDWNSIEYIEDLKIKEI